MSLQQLGFWVLAVTSVVTALIVITNPNPVRCAIFLVLNFACLAVLFLLLNAQLLAMLQVLVYAGAIMVLFLFVIMLLNLGGEQIEHDPLVGQRPLAAVLGIGLLFALVSALQRSAQLNPATGSTTAPALAAGEDQVRIIGQQLFVKYVYPFEITSLLLLVGIIGTILLAKRRLVPLAPDSGGVTPMGGPAPDSGGETPGYASGALSGRTAPEGHRTLAGGTTPGSPVGRGF
jgi:NADH-quinone oxidoreductase subunit J